MDMDNIFTSSEQVNNLRKSFEKLGFDADSALKEVEQNKYQLVAKSSCRKCWGTGNIRIEDKIKINTLVLGTSSKEVPSGNSLVDKLCSCVKVKKRKV